MVVRPSGGFHGTIGGGAMEWRALAEARETLGQGRGASRRSVVALGPELAQCCGGRVEWRIETFDDHDLERLRPLAEAERGSAPGRAVYLFGAGHVGRALALALAPLPFQLRWIDSREAAFPVHAPANATRVRSGDPPAELAAAPDGAFVIVMTHSHPLDLAIVAEALRQDRFGYVGLIGSATKRARFLSQMRAAGLRRGGARQARLPDRNIRDRGQGAAGDRGLGRRAAAAGRNGSGVEVETSITARPGSTASRTMASKSIGEETPDALQQRQRDGEGDEDGQKGDRRLMPVRTLGQPKSEGRGGDRRRPGGKRLDDFVAASRRRDGRGRIAHASRSAARLRCGSLNSGRPR